MITILVSVDVIPEHVEEFIRDTLHARTIYLESEVGCKEYSLVQDINDSTKITLIEKFVDEEAIEIHRNHYTFLEWRNKVQDMMATARKSTKNITL